MLPNDSDQWLIQAETFYACKKNNAYASLLHQLVRRRIRQAGIELRPCVLLKRSFQFINQAVDSN